MSESRNIQNKVSADLVTHRILVEGIELSSTYQVLTIVVEKELNRIPYAKLVLLDGDPATQDFSLSNEDYFIPGKEIEIKAGYHSHEETIFKGMVLKHCIKIRPTKSILTVECKDRAVRLTKGLKNKYFYESGDNEIVEQIIAEYGLPNNIEPCNVQHNEMVQYNVTDWDFCVTRMQANGKVVLVDDGTVSALAPNLAQQECLNLNYGIDILDFDAELDASNQSESIHTYTWDVANQEVQELEANTNEPSLNGNISAATLASVINLEKLELKEGSINSEAGLQDWANAKSLYNQLSKITGSVSFQGNAVVKPNTTLQLAGVGDRFNGKVYVSAIRHVISEGTWTSVAQFGLSAKWFSEKVDINPPPASGLLAAVNGLHISKVTALEGDPNGEYRVQVRMPMVNNQEQGVWARVASLDAGESRGAFFRPEIDDEVVVGFLNGNPNYPFILGMLNSSAKPAPIEPNDNNHEKGFVTRSEMKLLFNDENKSIVLETPAGKKITIDEDSGSITLEDENDNLLVLNSDGISLNSASDINISANGDISIEGNTIEIKASNDLKAEGSASAELVSEGTTKIEGSIVNIN